MIGAAAESIATANRRSSLDSKEARIARRNEIAAHTRVEKNNLEMNLGENLEQIREKTWGKTWERMRKIIWE